MILWSVAGYARPMPTSRARWFHFWTVRSRSKSRSTRMPGCTVTAVLSGVRASCRGRFRKLRCMTFASMRGCTIWVNGSDWKSPAQQTRPASLATSGTLGHLWHLGDFRVCKTTEPAPVFIARRVHFASPEALTSVLADPAWGRRGVVLTRERPDLPLPGAHEVRAFSDFIGTQEGEDRFDSAAFVRVLRSLTPSSASDERTQYLDGDDLKLPHFETAFRLSPARARIVKASWGTDGYPPPVVTWAETKIAAHSSYQSFDDAFRDGKLEREDVFELVEHGKYRLRRIP